MGRIRSLYKVLLLLLILNESFGVLETKLNRQKRCIVVQKQSGTHGDSTEDGGDDDDYRKPVDKRPAPDKRHDFREYENLLPVKYRVLPTKWITKNLRLTKKQ